MQSLEAMKQREAGIDTERTLGRTLGKRKHSNKSTPTKVALKKREVKE